MGFLGIAASTTATQCLGFFWYSGPVFGNIWCNNNGRRKEDMKTPVSTLVYLIPAVSKTITAGILTHMLKDHLKVTSVKEAMFTAVPISVIVTLYSASHAPFLGMRLPAFLIDVGYDVASTLLTVMLVTAL